MHSALSYYTLLCYTRLDTVTGGAKLQYTQLQNILCYTILYYTILYCTVLYCTVLYCTVLYCTVLYYTRLYYSMRDHTRLYDKTMKYKSLPVVAISISITITMLRTCGEVFAPFLAVCFLEGFGLPDVKNWIAGLPDVKNSLGGLYAGYCKQGVL